MRNWFKFAGVSLVIAGCIALAALGQNQAGNTAGNPTQNLLGQGGIISGAVTFTGPVTFNGPYFYAPTGTLFTVLAGTGGFGVVIVTNQAAFLGTAISYTAAGFQGNMSPSNSTFAAAGTNVFPTWTNYYGASGVTNVYPTTTNTYNTNGTWTITSATGITTVGGGGFAGNGLGITNLQMTNFGYTAVPPAMAVATYYTNTNSQNVTWTIVVTNTAAVADARIFPFKAAGSPRISWAVPLSTVASTNVIRVNLEPNGYFALSNFLGTVAVQTNEIQVWP